MRCAMSPTSPRSPSPLVVEARDGGARVDGDHLGARGAARVQLQVEVGRREDELRRAAAEVLRRRLDILRLDLLRIEVFVQIDARVGVGHGLVELDDETLHRRREAEAEGVARRRRREPLVVGLRLHELRARVLEGDVRGE